MLHTDAFPSRGCDALASRNIQFRRVDHLTPTTPKEFSNDVRFYDCWTKLVPFGLVEFDRVVQLDSDMMVRRNMDELMELHLDGDDDGYASDDAHGGRRIFAAAHACVCNPLHKKHYPSDWVPANCAYTAQHTDPTGAQATGMPSDFGLGIPNGGLQVVKPNEKTYKHIRAALQDAMLTGTCDFADQSLLATLFHGRWAPLPYVYNALKTIRWKGVHNQIWDDDSVKNVHYILDPKPWNEPDPFENRPQDGADTKTASGSSDDECLRWWWKMTQARRQQERSLGIDDGF